jgi:hypothetical protein
MQAASLEYINLDEENITNTEKGEANNKLKKKKSGGQAYDPSSY